jgi:hypothetical protein
MARFLAALLLCWASLLNGSNPDYQSAKQKFALVGNDEVPPGSSIFLTERELNAWLESEAPQAVPEGLRDPRLELDYGTATGSAWIDFLKLRETKGARTSWLLARLLEGERPVRVTARIHSGAGRATVDIERVEISGIAVSGAALDFLIENFLLAYYPNAKIGQPFELGHRIDRLDVKPSGVWVVIGP